MRPVHGTIASLFVLVLLEMKLYASSSSAQAGQPHMQPYASLGSASQW